MLGSRSGDGFFLGLMGGLLAVRLLWPGLEAFSLLALRSSYLRSFFGAL
jgi:hypothetical protein